MKLERKLAVFFAMGCMLAILLASCSRKTEYTYVIPSDVSMLVSMDIRSLWDKSGLDSKDAPARQKMMEILKGEVNEQTFSYMKEVMKNPSESGIRWDDPVYFFLSGQESGFVANVSKKSKLENSFKIWSAENKCSPIEDSGNYSYTIWEGRAICAFNENAILVMTSGTVSNPENLKERISQLMSQQEKNSIYSDQAFPKMKEQKGDIKLMAHGGELSSLSLPAFSMMIPYSSFLEDVTAMAVVDFERGKMSIRCEPYIDNKELAEYYKKINFLRKGKGQFLDYLPASALMFFNMNLDGEKMYNAFVENKDFSDAMNSAQQMGIDINKLFSCFDGDLSVAVTSLSQQGVGVIAYAEMRDNYFVNTLAEQKELMQMILGAKIEQKGKSAYQLSFRNMELYFGMLDKHFYVTNDTGILSSIDDKVSSSIAEAPWANTVKKSSSIFVLNADACLQTPVCRSVLDSGNPKSRLLRSFLSSCSYIQVYSLADGDKIEMDVVLKNQKENALKQLISELEEFSGVF